MTPPHNAEEIIIFTCNVLKSLKRGGEKMKNDRKREDWRIPGKPDLTFSFSSPDVHGLGLFLKKRL
jgi:hypothetical protein